MSQTDNAANYHTGRENEVLDAALQLFADKGFAATSVREIVLKAGLSKPALYYHFGSKEGLLRAILDEGFAEFELRVRQSVESAVDARDALTKFLEACFDVASKKPQLATLIYQVSFGSEGSSGGVDVSGLVRKNQILVSSVIDRAVREGLVSPDRADNAVLLFNGVLNIHLMAFIKGDLRTLSPELAREAVDFYLWGMAGAAPRSGSVDAREG